MDTPPQVMSHHQPNALSSIILPDEIVTEILSLLSVKSLMRLRCVSKSWNSLMIDPFFIKTHLKKSARNAHLILLTSMLFMECTVVSSPIHRLLDPTRSFDPYYGSMVVDCSWIIGSCNGLLCLLGYHETFDYFQQTWLRFWNPTTRTVSKRFGSFVENQFAFGYDNVTDTYKVVVSKLRSSEASLFSLGDNVCRIIQSFPVIPLRSRYTHQYDSGGVYLNGTLNWLAIRDKFVYDPRDIAVEQFVIVSLDLHTETYLQLLLPRGFDEVPLVQPIVRVLMDCLCFSHYFEGTHFVIWKMNEFGVEESWTQLLKISYLDLQYDYYYIEQLFLYPLCLSEDADTLILAFAFDQLGGAIL